MGCVTDQKQCRERHCPATENARRSPNRGASRTRSLKEASGRAIWFARCRTRNRLILRRGKSRLHAAFVNATLPSAPSVRIGCCSRRYGIPHIGTKSNGSRASAAASILARLPALEGGDRIVSNRAQVIPAIRLREPSPCVAQGIRQRERKRDREANRHDGENENSRSPLALVGQYRQSANRVLHGDATPRSPRQRS